MESHANLSHLPIRESIIVTICKSCLCAVFTLRKVVFMTLSPWESSRRIIWGFLLRNDNDWRVNQWIHSFDAYIAIRWECFRKKHRTRAGKHKPPAMLTAARGFRKECWRMLNELYYLSQRLNNCGVTTPKIPIHGSNRLKRETVSRVILDESAQSRKSNMWARERRHSGTSNKAITKCFR